MPHKEWPITSRNNYEIGIRWYREVQDNLEKAGTAEVESTIAEYASLYGKMITSPSGFSTLRVALLGGAMGADTRSSDVEMLSETIKTALVKLTLAPSPAEYLERARSIHALAKVQADALFEEIITLADDSPLVQLKWTPSSGQR